MADDFSYPTMDPSHFDLIVVGTGLPESVFAASSSANGKSLLHIDPNSFYGGHFASLSLNECASFLNSQQQFEQQIQSLTSGDGGSDYIAVDLKPRCLYSHVEISSPGSSEDLRPCGNFNLDLSGPRVMFCADSALNLIIKSGAKNQLDFISIEASFIYREDGKLYTVPDSRSAIFKDRTLGLMEKNQLMRFFKLVQEHIGSNATTHETDKTISIDDLETPFVDFLTKQKLPPKIKSIILYAIAMADYDQESPELCKNIVTTKDGIESLAIYHSSVGRFTNAPGAFMYPMYGQGELPQAFCRCAAVKGAVYVLRMPVRALLFEKESRQYKGLRLASGQEVFSNKLVIGPSFIVPSPAVSSPLSDFQQETSDGSIVKDVDGQVARAVCITRGSIVSGVSNLLVIFPPRSLYPEQVTSVRVLQLGSGSKVCPSGLFVLYLSALCDDAAQGKDSLHAAIKALLTCSVSESHGKSASEQNESVETTTLLWSAMYIQPLTKLQVSSNTISSCPMPDGNLENRDIWESTEKLFDKMYPDDEFMPERNMPEDIADEQES